MEDKHVTVSRSLDVKRKRGGSMEGSLGVRKRAWTKEDNRLRKCVEKYGVQKWHQVPLRAGLNRCRKSCRLRWLNYLHPNIKRGKFEADEVDLILRLHKLLGNRWSLIAGRLPGRTLNDVKNYFNIHLGGKVVSYNKDVNEKDQNIENVEVIKPRPRTLSKTRNIGNSTQPGQGYNLFKPPTTLNNPYDNESMWWESLLATKEFDQLGTSSSIENLWPGNFPPGTDVEDSFNGASQSFATITSLLTT